LQIVSGGKVKNGTLWKLAPNANDGSFILYVTFVTFHSWNILNCISDLSNNSSKAKRKPKALAETIFQSPWLEPMMRLSLCLRQSTGTEQLSFQGISDT
jgi:hypothetical protein